jgi:hypothetical protein
MREKGLRKRVFVFVLESFIHGQQLRQEVIRTRMVGQYLPLLLAFHVPKTL